MSVIQNMSVNQELILVIKDFKRTGTYKKQG